MERVCKGLKIAAIVLLACEAWPLEAATRQAERPGRRGLKPRGTETARAERLQPLLADTVGAHELPAATVVPGAGFSLSIDGDLKLGRHVFKEGPYYPGDYPFLHNEGFANTALGLYGLMNVTPDYPSPYDGSGNTALGQVALYNTTSGTNNTGIGVAALYPNIDGAENTAVGWWAMGSYTPGGDRNTALGAYAGYDTDGSDNILIGSRGVAGESNTLRIGDGTGTGSFQLETAFIHGIRNAILSGTDEQPVCVDDGNQLGPCTGISSARFKEDVEAMGDASQALLALRPVIFRYRPGLKTARRDREFGLIAEQVAEVFPELVSYDEEGEPFTVRYHVLSTLLLNELQRQHRQIRVLQVALGAMFVLGAAWVGTRL